MKSQNRRNFDVLGPVFFFGGGGCQPPVGGRGGRIGSEMGPLSSPGKTSYRLTIATTGLHISLTVFAVLRMFQTDGWTDGSGLAKVHRPPKIQN